MLRLALALARKDLALALRGAGLSQSLLLGLLLVFLFSLSQRAGDVAQGQAAADVFWLSSLFCQALVFNSLYALEEANDARTGLLLSPLPVTGVFLGKALAGLLLLLLAQLLFFPAILVFLGQSPEGEVPSALAMLLLVDLGLATLGSLLGALSRGQGRESLLSVLVFPLLAPLLLAGIRAFAVLFGEPGELLSWLGFAAAFDAIFLAAALLRFRFTYAGDE